jgi:D-inositol-3-phosphate glycosyltransferase
MRVAMLSYHTCPIATLGGKDTGGMNVYVRELTKQLGVMDVHVDVFTRSQDEHVPHVLHDLGYGNRVVHICAGPEIPLPKQQLAEYLPEFVDGVLAFTQMKKLRYDVIHSHYWMSGIAAIFLQDEWKIPYIQMFHTLGLMKQRVARANEEREGDYRVEGEKKVIKQADCIVAATPAELAQLHWLYSVNPNKVVIIPPGVDPRRFYPIPTDEAKDFIGVSRDEKILLFVGRIEPLKGIDTLIQALSLMEKKNFFKQHPFRMSIIGGEPETESVNLTSEMIRLQEMRSRYGVTDIVTFLGKKAQDTLPYYYSAAEAVVVPSFYESFGMVALEAMACGTPVVASQVGGLAFLVQDRETGFTVPVEDAEALAEKLMLILCDSDLRRYMGERASEFAKLYSWERIASQMIKLYDEVLGSL